MPENLFQSILIYFLLPLISGIVGGWVSRKKYIAEIDRIKAETEKAKAETEKIRAELSVAKLNPTTNVIRTRDEENNLVERVIEKVRNIQEQSDNIQSEALYKPPKLSDRIAYLYAVRQDIENKIREMVLSDSGGWPGSSAAWFDTYLGHAIDLGLVSTNLAEEIDEFYRYTQIILNSGDATDSEFQLIQYLATSINIQLDYQAARNYNVGN